MLSSRLPQLGWLRDNYFIILGSDEFGITYFREMELPRILHDT